METLQSLILGVVQGITEFLPISSTAHLVILPWLMSWQDNGLPFNVALHIGSLIAILTYFRKDWLSIIQNFFKCTFSGSFAENRDGRLGGFLVIGTIPGVISGLLLENQASGIFRNPLIVAINLAAFAVFLLLADRKSKTTKQLEDLDILDCLYFGIAQAFAIFPGVSRAGVTITGGLLRNFKREEAAKFSFLLGAPLILGAAVLQSRHLELSFVLSTPFLAGVISSAITAFLTIRFLLDFVSRQNFLVFVIYRFFLAAFIVFTIFIR